MSEQRNTQNGSEGVCAEMLSRCGTSFVLDKKNGTRGTSLSEQRGGRDRPEQVPSPSQVLKWTYHGGCNSRP